MSHFLGRVHDKLLVLTVGTGTAGKHSAPASGLRRTLELLTPASSGSSLRPRRTRWPSRSDPRFPLFSLGKTTVNTI